MAPIVIAISLAGVASAESESSRWRNIGPFGGKVSSIEEQSLRPGTLYAGAEWGYVGAGVFRTDNSGRTWTPARVGMAKDTGVLSLAADPFDPDVIYAGTGEYKGVLRSSDGGGHWASASSGIPPSVFAIWSMGADPHTRGRIVAGSDSGIYVSADGGQSWQRAGIQGYDAYPWAFALEFDPVASGVVYAGCAGALLKSEDGGSSWFRSDAGIPKNETVVDVATDPRGNGWLYALDGYFYLYKSVDRAKTWRRLKPLFTDANSVEVDISNPDTIYLGVSRRGVLRSTDAGETWLEYKTGLPRIDSYYDIVASRSHPGTVWAATDRGVYRSQDWGQTWSEGHQGLTANEVMQVVVPPGRSGTIYALVEWVGGRGICRTGDWGRTWEALKLEEALSLREGEYLSFRVIACDQRDPDVLYVGLERWGLGRASVLLLKTRDGGNTWSIIFRRDDEDPPIRALVVSPINPDTVYMALDYWGYEHLDPPQGVYRSGDAGETWTRLSAVPNSEFDISTMAVDAIHPMTLYLGGDTGIYKSEDGGRSWRNLTRAIPDMDPITKIAVNSADPSIVYAAAERKGVYASKDGGLTWARMTSSPRRTIKDIALHPANPDVIYLGTFHDGLYRSLNAGRSWERFDDGLKTELVWALAVDSSDPGKIYAAGPTTGLWVRTSTRN